MLQTAISSITGCSTSEASDKGSGLEIQEATTEITTSLKTLSRSGLHRYLPTTAIACTALPLALQILDVKLSPNAPRDQLQKLVEVMKTYETQYDGVEWATETIKAILNPHQLLRMGEGTAFDGSSLKKSAARPHNWIDLLAAQPSLYLRLAVMMDLSFSKGRLPMENDFPSGIRSLFSRISLDLSPVLFDSPPKHTSVGQEDSQLDLTLEFTPYTNEEDGLSIASESDDVAMHSYPREQWQSSTSGESLLQTEEEQIYSQDSQYAKRNLPQSIEQGVEPSALLLDQLQKEGLGISEQPWETPLVHQYAGSDAGLAQHEKSAGESKTELLDVWTEPYQTRPEDEDDAFLLSWLDNHDDDSRRNIWAGMDF